MVSVIIPIFNVKSFIKKGLNQILRQTYSDYEIILVDDGSTDGSYEDCIELSKKDKRIRVLHQKNMGAGGARNLGIDNAKGEFIYFYDIDDELSNTLLEHNVKIMNDKDVDMIVFGYTNVETTYKSKVTVSFPQLNIQTNQELKDIFIDEFVIKTNGFPWNKFYRKSFLDRNNLRYEDQRIQQDEVFNLMCYQHIEKIYLSSEILYTYYIYEKGNTRSRFIPNRFEIYKSVRLHFEQLKSFWNLNDIRLENYLNERFYTSVIQCLMFNLLHPDCPWDKKQKKIEMHRIMSDSLTLKAFDYIDTKDNNLETVLIKKACRNENLYQIKLYRILFETLHNIRKKLR